MLLQWKTSTGSHLVSHDIVPGQQCVCKPGTTSQASVRDLSWKCRRDEVDKPRWVQRYQKLRTARTPPPTVSVLFSRRCMLLLLDINIPLKVFVFGPLRAPQHLVGNNFCPQLRGVNYSDIN